MAEAFDVFSYPSRGPIERDTLDAVIATAQERLDLVTVVRERYGARVEVAGERWKTACFLPSTVESFAGSCAQQDASDKSSAAEPTNLWVSEGDSCRVWRCHSCGRRGDVIDLLEHADGLTRSTGQSVSLSAVRCAAKLSGLAYLLDGRAPDDRDDPSALVAVDAPQRIVKHVAPVVPFKRARAINARAAKHWRSMLTLGPGYLARAELKRRGVTDEQRDRYVLGYAEDKWRELVEVLPAAAIDEAKVLGLVGRTRQGKLYDRYRARIMFPYCEPNREGRREAVTGFAGRSFPEEGDAPKWFNSTNTSGVWVKSSALLGLLQARERLDQTGSHRVTVGEGGWEVLAFDRLEAACVGLVAAPMSLDHVHVIATVLGARRITLAGDGDEVGRRGVFAGAISALKYGYQVADLDVIDPDTGEDPGKIGETAEGLERLRAMWERPQPLVDFIRAREGVATGQQKRGLVAVLPVDLAREFAEQWGINFDRVEIDDTLTPSASFVAQLLADPSTAAHLSADEVRAVFEHEPLVLQQIEALDFGTTTDLASLRPALRRAWLTCYAEHLEREVAAHDQTDKFAGGQGHASFKAWFKRGDDLRKQIENVRQVLATLQGAR